jgi:hypothetical protein
VILTINRFNPLSLCSVLSTTHIPIRNDYGCTVDPTDFQLKYAPRAWKQERLVWTSVVQLNLIKNVNSILDVLGQEMAIQTTKVDSTSGVAPVTEDQFSGKHRVLKLRLAPLRSIQTDLERKLGSGALEDHGQLNNNGRERAQSTPAINGSTSLTESPPVDGNDLQIQPLPKEFYIRSHNSWKDRLKSGLKSVSRPYSGGSAHTSPRPWSGNEGIRLGVKDSAYLEEIASIIAGCREDMKALWEDELVQKILSKRKHRVDESSGLCVLRSLNHFTAAED